VDELTVFPSGRYRDQVDAASGAFNKLALVGQVTTAPNPFYD
jgi:phage terminase large subunit-like protein